MTTQRWCRWLVRSVLMWVLLSLLSCTFAVEPAEETAMLPIQLAPIPLAEAATAHRIVFAGAPSRLILGAMAPADAALRLFLVRGQTATPAADIPLLLPARVDFDLVPVAGPGVGQVQGFWLAYEAHGGAVSRVQVQGIGTTVALDLPAPGAIVDERHPRFVRGRASAIVISEDGERAVLLDAERAPRRPHLCDCLDAIGVVTPVGFAILVKTLRPGAPIADVSPGGLSLHWPAVHGPKQPPQPLFGNADVFDYDAIASGTALFVAAVLDSGPAVAMLPFATGTPQSIPVDGLPAPLESFSPALAIDATSGALTLAVLARNPSDPNLANMLWRGVSMP